MCGIVGYLGTKDALPVIISGLEKLEYRGYDSTGVAIFEDGKVTVTRALGKLQELKKLFISRNGDHRAPIGIGHTRWATHGRPSETNAHPHTAGRVSLVHNGIIENYLELREELEAEGCKFKSETDTEIAAHLLDKYLRSDLTPFAALKAACGRIRGSYAFVALDAETPDRILVAKNASPMIVGVGEGEMIVASDIPAVLNHTRKVIILEDGDLAEITADGITIENNGHAVPRAPISVTWDPVTAQKGGYKHFMLKEIHEQGSVIADTIRGRIELEQARVIFPELSLSVEQIKQLRRIVLIACGTAWHACLVAKFYLETFAKLPCEVDYASEFRYREPLLDQDTLVMAVSQSGETADTLAAIDLSNRFTTTLAVCNVLGSSIARKVKNVIFTHAGPEISVASTKAFTTQLTALYLLAIYFAQCRGTLSTEKARPLLGEILKVPGYIDEALKCEPLIEELSKKFSRATDFLFLGRGICYPIALEGALKMKEISYIHAEGYPAGEMKHGPIALIDERVPVVVVLQKSDQLFEKTLSNLKEVESRGGQIVAITDVSGNKELSKVAAKVVELPCASEYLSPIVLTVPLQLLAYYVAVFNGTDVDLPRNLAKSVTVE